MACEAEKKFAPSSYDLYGGMYGGKAYGATGNGKIDRFQGWSRYNAATLKDTRIGSSSKEDTYNHGATYNYQAESFTSSPKPVYNQGLDSPRIARGVSQPDAPRPARSASMPESPKVNDHAAGIRRVTSQTQAETQAQTADRKIETPVPVSTPRVRHARSASSGVPPFGGFVGKPAASPIARGASSPPDALSIPEDQISPPSDGTTLNREGLSGTLRREGSRTLHRRGSSDMAGLRTASLFNAAENPNSGIEGGRLSGSSPSDLKLKVGVSPFKESSPKEVANGSCSGGSSRGSSVAGSPTVARTSSTENLFGGVVGNGSYSSSTSPTSGGASFRSSSGNVGNLLGAVSSGSGCYTGGGLNTGPSTPRMGTSKTAAIPTVAPPALQGKVSGYASNGKVMYGGGLANSNGANGSGRSETPRASADAVWGRGNIQAVGESLHIKRMLSSCDPDDVKNAGNEQYKKGNFQEALSLYDRAVFLAPARAPYHSNRAAALSGLGRLPEAVRECEEAIKLDSSYLRAHQRLAALYLRLGRLDGARRHFKISGEQADLSDLQRMEKIWKHVAKCFEARKVSDWQTVVRESDAAVVAGADSAPQVFALKAEALLRLRRHEEADSVLSAAQKVEGLLRKSTSMSADITTFLVQAQIDMAFGRFEAAVITAEKAAYFDPKNYEVTLTLRKARAVASARTTGNNLYKAGKVLEAAVAYSEGLQYEPTSAILLCNRAACRSKQGHYESAVEDCNAALDAQPNYLKALLRRANSYLKMERWDKALRDYETLRKEMPGDLDIARTLFEVQVAVKKSKGEEVDETQFGGEVEDICSNEQLRGAISQPGLAVVQFNTRWSDRCRQMATYVEQLCKLNPTVNFLKVDVEENPYLAKAESVSFVPTFKIYKNGFKVKELLGPTHQALETAVGHFSL